MFAGGRLELAFKKALQVCQTFGVAKNGLQGLGLAEQNGGCPCWVWAKCHVQTPEKTEPQS